ncbi:hypothetical protein L1887_37540 [Cichorium endivia]|nr:hypothetical protein L1887_37540 [Cichorium endivia]
MVIGGGGGGGGSGDYDVDGSTDGGSIFPSYLTNYTPSPPPPHTPTPTPPPIPSLFFFNPSFYSQKLLESLLPRLILRKKGGLSSLHVSR